MLIAPTTGSPLKSLRYRKAAGYHGPISRSTHSRNGVLVGAAIEANFQPPIRTAVINAGVWQTLPLVSVTSHRDPRRINAIFDHVTSHSTGARRRQLPA